jgi:hypothetical protein
MWQPLLYVMTFSLLFAGASLTQASSDAQEINNP